MPKEQTKPSLEIPNLTLSFLVHELKPLLVNAYVNKVQQMQNQIIKFKVHTSQGDRTLLISANSIYLTAYPAQAKPNPTSFAGFLIKHLNNERILKFEQIGSERIVVLEFRSCKLYCELFAEGNIIFTDLENKILMPFKPKSWSVRTLKKGETYQLPPARGFNPNTVSFSEFSQALKTSSKNLIQSLVSKINLAPVIAEQICADCSSEKTLSPEKLSPIQIKHLFERLQFYYIQSLQTLVQPTLIQSPNKQFLLPFSLPLFSQVEQKKYTSFTHALDELNLGTVTQASPQAVKETQAQIKHLSELEYSIQQQHVLLNECQEKAKEYAEAGERIYSHYPELAEVLVWIQENLNKKSTEEQVAQAKKKFAFIQHLDVKKNELIVEL